MQAGQAVQNPIIHFYNTVLEPSITTIAREASRVSTVASGIYEDTRRSVVDAARQNLSEPMANLVDRVSRVFPEVVVVSSAMTGILTPVAFFYTAYQALSPVIPELQTIVNPESNHQQVDEAKARAMNGFVANVNRFIPAITAVCTVASAVLGVTGIVTLSPTRLLNAGLFGLTAFSMHNAELTQAHVDPNHPHQQ